MRLKLHFVLFGVFALCLVQKAAAQPCPPATYSASIPTPLSIPDPGTRTSTITVAGGPTFLTNVKVFVNITHTWSNDLDITLTSPSGKVITLSTDNGGSLDNVFAGTLFTDNAGATNAPGAVTDVVMANGTPETPVAPEEGLAAFIGENANGTWTLTITDDTGADVGTLVAWSLEFLGRQAAWNTATTTVSNNTNLNIVDNTTVSKTITVSGAGTQLLDLNVLTNITHTWCADMTITLTSPAGTVVTLSSVNGGSNDNLFNGTLWDDNAGATNAPGPIGDVTFANGVAETPLCPEEPFGAFFGENPNGTWTISINDGAGGDQGVLSTWELHIVTLVDNQAPAVTAHPVGVAVCANENVTFSGTGTNATGYQWQVSAGGGAFSDIPGATTATLSLTNVTAAMDGNRYRLVVYGICSQAVSNAAILTVYRLPAIVSLNANPKTKIHPGQLTSLEATFEGMPGTFQWYRNNTLVQTTIAPTITGLSVDSLGTYRVVLRDVNGCVASSANIVLSADPNWEFYVYPTPTTNGQFQVRFYSYTLGGKRTLNVYDAKGNLVFKREVVVNNPYERMDVDVSKYLPGVYLVELRDANGDLLGTGSTVFLK